ncbi:MAG TPA: hypothetical protein VMS17_25415 [Gemmataceae bacterium]|nr:hypothetical protein [Gemmataceae bacterium]
MPKSLRRIGWSIALLALLGLILPTAALAASHNPGRGGASSGRSQAVHVRQGRTRPDAHVGREVAARRRDQSGPLSYNAYWKAAMSPNPPRPNQNYNRYWEKMQAWQENQWRRN